MSKLTISSKDVKNFKEIFSNENLIIREIIKDKFYDYFKEPILDIGSGTGDILSYALPNKKVIYLDVLDFSDHTIPDDHVRIVDDFFPILEKGILPKINTLFLCHVQQFIDHDIEYLNRNISHLDADNIVLVENTNTDFMKEIINFSNNTFINSNPELNLPNFPVGYKLVTSIEFVGKVNCTSFLNLATQCLYLMDVQPSSENLKVMQEYLKNNLNKPNLDINQRIKIYEKE